MAIKSVVFFCGEELNCPVIYVSPACGIILQDSLPKFLFRHYITASIAVILKQITR